ncbi:leucyl aminopeptidase [Salinibacterium sp. SYSU T00001]|uniref:leucyl aminopeptidase n=1 Tax=Homoserinimonas sedimenticola TaxID=2986805 RepID=UPI002235CF1D|nr:leucyl aminopeptidase [Salinibacterium sedimenticola]MCW4384514.1 leucyl aminopeptidase [Salinibacterium sedimenticola]
MTTPQLSVVGTAPEKIKADILVVGVSSGDSAPVLHSGLSVLDPIRDRLTALGVTGARDEIVRVPVENIAAGAVALVGLGRGELSPESLRLAAGSASRQLVGIDTLALALPVVNAEDLSAVLEGAAIGAYAYTSCRGKTRESAKVPAGEILIASDLSNTSKQVERAAAIAQAMAVVRDLVNAPPAELYPQTLAERAVAAAEGLPIDVTVLTEMELEAGGYGGLLGVGKGSSRGPRLVRLDYAPQNASGHLALVGKGITFDTGGLSLKPAASMVGMKYDMAGAASVLGVLLAAARLALPVHLTGWLCLAENMPSGDAMRPNDVLTVRGGTTIEVLNTDAEGRLVLADGLVAAGEESPDAIIDIATLTGAAIVALGNRYSGVMGDEALVSRLCASAERVGEKFWPMPLPEELRSSLNSDIADIANAKIGNTAGGMLLAAVFLKEFATPAATAGSTIPWAHIDIAGSANNSGSGYGFTGKGATAVGVRALLDLAASFRGA